MFICAWRIFKVLFFYVITSSTLVVLEWFYSFKLISSTVKGILRFCGIYIWYWLWICTLKTFLKMFTYFFDFLVCNIMTFLYYQRFFISLFFLWLGWLSSFEHAMWIAFGFFYFIYVIVFFLCIFQVVWFW